MLTLQQRSNGKIYLHELHPDEDGRGAIIDITDGKGREVLPKQYSALSQVHEYGGGAVSVRQMDGHLVFTDIKTKGVFLLNPDTSDVEPIVEANEKIYFADFDCHPNDKTWVLAIKEDHTTDPTENSFVAIDTSSKKVHTLASGCDFYTYPRFSPDGKKVAWVQFNLPHMPWDGSELWVGDFDNGQVSNKKQLTGREKKVSSTQPLWAADGTLFFVDDKTGFWQLYHYANDKVEHVALKGLEEAEFGHPDWFLGGQTYAQLTNDTMIAFYVKDGYRTAILINLKDNSWKDLHCPVIELQDNTSALKPINATSFALLGCTKSLPLSLFIIDINNASQPKLVKSSSAVDLPEDFAPTAEPLKFPRTRSSDGGEARALFYPPTNPNYKGPSDKLPPLIVMIHGGPTAMEGPGLSLTDAFWTTRGYAVAQINYIGSTGYGRAYASQLKSRWGRGDIEDAVSCVDHLVSRSLIDSTRVGITGHSAGGYATMQALGIFPQIYTCGIAESGISDLIPLFRETHKFESRYLQPLIFGDGYDLPNNPDDWTDHQKSVVADRSPITHVDKIKSPMLILGGKEDPICPPNQNTTMQEKLRKNGVENDMALYDGEAHVILKGSTLKDMAVRREKWFRRFLVDE